MIGLIKRIFGKREPQMQMFQIPQGPLQVYATEVRVSENCECGCGKVIMAIDGHPVFGDMVAKFKVKVEFAMAPDTVSSVAEALTELASDYAISGSANDHFKDEDDDEPDYPWERDR